MAYVTRHDRPACYLAHVWFEGSKKCEACFWEIDCESAAQGGRPEKHEINPAFVPLCDETPTTQGWTLPKAENMTMDAAIEVDKEQNKVFNCATLSKDGPLKPHCHEKTSWWSDTSLACQKCAWRGDCRNEANERDKFEAAARRDALVMARQYEGRPTTGRPSLTGCEKCGMSAMRPIISHDREGTRIIDRSLCRPCYYDLKRQGVFDDVEVVPYKDEKQRQIDRTKAAKKSWLNDVTIDPDDYVTIEYDKPDCHDKKEEPMKTETLKSDALTAGHRINGCTLESLVGKGSFGEVWKAKTEDGKVVALKVALDPEFARMVQTEEKLQHSLDHKGIVKTLGANPSNEPPYIMMEYIEGENLRDKIKREGGLSEAGAVEVFKDLVTALDYAHQNGVIHRDIKPENILIAKNGQIKLTDFGLGKMLDTARSSLFASGVSRTGTGRDIVGTLNYMSPEQKKGEDVDKRTDIYAVGVVLFELLTGELPDRAEKPSDHRAYLPKALDAIYASCCARLEKRFTSTKAVLHAISYYEDHPEELPPTTFQKITRVITAPMRLVLWATCWTVFAATMACKVVTRPIEWLHKRSAKRLGRRPVYESLADEFEKDAGEWAATADRMKRRALEAEGRAAQLGKKASGLEVDLMAARVAKTKVIQPDHGNLAGIGMAGDRTERAMPSIYGVSGVTRVQDYSAFDVEGWDGRCGSVKAFNRVAGKGSHQTNMLKAGELPFRESFDVLGIQVSLLSKNGSRLNTILFDEAASVLCAEFEINSKRVVSRVVVDMDSKNDGKTACLKFEEPFHIGKGECFGVRYVIDQGSDSVKDMGGIDVRTVLIGQIRTQVQ